MSYAHGVLHTKAVKTQFSSLSFPTFHISQIFFGLSFQIKSGTRAEGTFSAVYRFFVNSGHVLTVFPRRYERHFLEGTIPKQKPLNLDSKDSRHTHNL